MKIGFLGLGHMGRAIVPEADRRQLRNFAWLILTCVRNMGHHLLYSPGEKDEIEQSQVSAKAQGPSKKCG